MPKIAHKTRILLQQGFIIAKVFSLLLCLLKMGQGGVGKEGKHMGEVLERLVEGKGGTRVVGSEGKQKK